ncbi:MAG: 6-carboxytetrahydropterin synthase [Candidatus Krumholzibacteriota bacterium]|nr:6-carboxytetrahydropterin synthase [Candidatus Krumholzibacteriota bacterium]
MRVRKMAGIYTISTEIMFSASHSLPGYDGDCARVHGHNWVVRAYYEFTAVDENGLTADFLELKAGMEKVILPRFDHQHLNDIPPFNSINPTSENIAAEIFRLCREQLSFRQGTLREIELWETLTDKVSYRE